jgi:plasmid stabilization system protein ParE
MKCWFHPEARIEFLESVVYYESQQTGLGQRYLEAVTEAVRRIQAHPNMYRLVGEAWRQCRIPKFPFGIIYRVRNRRIEVIALMHLHRRPGYWQNRNTI